MELGVGRAGFIPARAEPKYTFENIGSSRAKEFFNNFYMAKIEHEIF